MFNNRFFVHSIVISLSGVIFPMLNDQIRREKPLFIWCIITFLNELKMHGIKSNIKREEQSIVPKIQFTFLPSFCPFWRFQSDISCYVSSSGRGCVYHRCLYTPLVISIPKRYNGKLKRKIQVKLDWMNGRWENMFCSLYIITRPVFLLFFWNPHFVPFSEWFANKI